MRFGEAVIRQSSFLSALTKTLAPQPALLPLFDNSKPQEAVQHKVVLGLSFADEDQGTLARLAPLGMRIIPARHWKSGVGV